jgi:cell filamentation protein
LARYDLTGGRNEEFEPGSRNRVLRNLLGITGVREIQAAETDALVEAQFWSYQDIGEDECFSIGRLCELHRKWLGGIYPFASEYREVNVSKGIVMFSPAYFIEQNLAEFEQSLLSKLTPCRAESHEDLSLQLAMGTAFGSKNYNPLATVFLEALHRSEQHDHFSKRSESR